ncbi:non-ribosomal peptide synthetase [Myxococcus stipitatus DSM 14675]|uniref:Non-ribosomal peptide synthetase n=1 Tax=Myxococcus stipitatus (strain DSM 14675 / JCM 12634 / Mx s8) TaxID=1278073 RepID=L7U1P9_MYXSD|nr:non-ribosomal peptide synthetase [Myxococcus stipitatus]AGC42721.1 non-ribosomal peptide synthetase [Myxococcus stipitatus DSM 14675]
MSAHESKPASPRVRRPPPVVAARRDGPLPLSFAQRRMWFLSRMDPSGFAYNAPFFSRLSGPLDVAALERALDAVVRRHEALRTTFVEVEGEPVQCIAPDAPVVLEVRRLEGPEREREARRRAEEEARRPFDLSVGPMLRASLLRLDEEEHVLLLTLHHIACDGWSLSLLELELRALYAASLDGREPMLPALKVQYADHAMWQREWLTGEVLEEQLAWWKGHLAGASPALVLPVDRPRPPVQSSRGAVLGVPFPAELMRALEARCKQESVTPFMWLLSALQAVLSRHSGQRDVVVGTPIAGRSRREVEGLIGFFANTLALRVDVEGSEPFQGLLKRVRQACLGAYQHQDVPFEKLVDALRPVRDLSRTPLFQVLLVLQNAPPLVRLAGVESRDLDFEPGVAKFDLTLFVRETPEGWMGFWEYSTALFDEATVRRLAGHYGAFLSGVVSNPALEVGQVELLDEEEKREVLVEWSGRQVVERPAELVHRWVEAQVSRTPDAVAVTDGRESLTYAQLEQRANQVAHHLISLGLRPGSALGLCLERSSLDVPVVVLAALKAGVTYLPLDPVYPPGRLAQMLEDVGAPVVLVHASLEHALPEACPARRVRLEDEQGRIATRPTTGPDWELSPELPCYVIFTSGSTGRPKGVTMSHRGVGTLVEWQTATTSARGSRTLQFSSLSFDVSFQEMFCTWSEGGTLVLVSAATHQDPALLLTHMREHRVERLFLPYVALQALCERARHEAELPPLREVATAGEALHVTPALVSFFERLPGCVLENQYGPVEGHVVTAWRARGAPSTWPALPPVGRPISLATVYVLDAWGAPCPVGVTGEVYLGARSLAHGYWGRAELTAERFVPDAFHRGEDGRRLYRTGDLARWLADGNLELQGRRDAQVKVRGFRVEPGEVEVALKEQPGVGDAVVVVRASGRGDKQLVGFVVSPLAWDAEALKRQLGARLPEYMVPASLIRVDVLPLAPSGKVDRRALETMEVERGDEGAGYEAPRDARERMLAEVWGEVLGLAPVGVRDDFFALGGHSLLATRVVSRLRDLLGQDVPVRLLFEAPTVRALAERLSVLAGHVRLPELQRAVRREDTPLSFAQQRLWFLAQLDAGGHSYNLPFVVRLQGAVEVEALERSLVDVVRRHEALRTSFVEVDGEPVQRVSPDATLSLGVELLDGTEEVEEAVRRRVVREVQAPFDVSRGPLLRATLLHTGGDSHVLMVVLHHLVADGGSLSVLSQELEALYAAALKGEVAALPALPVQYADYTLWQRGWLKGDVEAAQLAWWGEALKGAPPVLEWPTDRPRPAVQTYRGASVPVCLSAELTESLRRLGRREGVTLYMTLLAAFQTFLARYSGQWDVVVGTPVSGRTAKETEALVGFFVNTLALRARPGAEATFQTFLRETKETVLGAFAHQDVPFERLVEHLRPERDLSRSPLFQVLFTLQEATPLLSLPGVQARPWDFASTIAKFDLELLLVDAPGAGVEGQLIYNADLFEPATVQRIAECFLELSRNLVASPEARLSSLSLLPEAARQRMLVEWNQTAVEFPREACVHHLFEAQVALRPDAVALEFGEQRWSYRALDARANQLAWALRARGVGADTLVAVCLERSVELIVALLGILKAGGAYVPLDSSYPARRWEQMLEDSAPRLLLTTRALSAQLPESSLPELMLLEDLRWEEWPSTTSRMPVSGRNLAYVDFTSGSTGRPKGVAVEHRGVLRLLYGAPYARLGPEETFLLIAPISFDASTLEVWGPLCLGGRLVVFPPRSPSELDLLKDVLRRHSVTLLHLTAGLFSQMVELEMEGLKGVRQLLTGGDVVSAPHVRRVLEELGIPVTACYGPTESTLFTSTHRMARVEDVGASVPIGRPIGNTQVYVLDAGLEPVPVGVAGELFIGGDGLARGYLRQPDVTADRFIPNPFSTVSGERLYRTGDLARWRVDGVLEFLGRRDSQVKVRGYRIELGEVEAALLAHPSVKDGLVVARDGVGGKRLVAYYVEHAETPDAPVVKEWLKQRLPEFMVPSAFVKLDALPLTANGKVDRKALPSPEQEGAAGDEAQGPRSVMEGLVARIWMPLLGVARVGVKDDFFALGGHSLLATRVVSRLREALGREVPVRMLFEAPTLESLAERLEAMKATTLGTKQAPALVRVPRSEGMPLSFAQRRLWFLGSLDAGGYSYNLPFVVRLRGVLDVAALEHAFTELVWRHEALRTTFAEVEGEPVQRIASPEPVRVQVVDARGVATRPHVEALARASFDLTKGPLLRVTLVKEGEGEHVMVVVVHHIVADGWSMGVMAREVEALYGAYVKGEEGKLEEVGLQYADYAVWQREWMKGAVLEEQLGWWRERLRGAPEVLEVPTDRARPAVQGYRGASVAVRMKEELAEGLRELSRREGVTLYMTLLAGFQTLLARYSGQWDVVVGSPVSGRTVKEVEGLIGFFVNTMVVRTEAGGELTFREMLGKVKESVLGALGHQEVPFEKLVEAMSPARDMSRAPLVQVAFGLNGPARLPRLPGVSASEVEYEPGMAKFDLALSVREDAEDLTSFWELNTDLFERETVERMAAHYQQLLEAAVREPETRLDALPMAGHRDVPVKRALTAPPLKKKAQWTPEGFIAPRTALEELVADTWAPLLGMKRVGAEDHFFDQGGHSLLVMQVASRLREVLGRDIPVRMLFESPRLSELASHLEDLVRGTPGPVRPALPPVSSREVLPQSFAQQRLWFLDRLEPNSPLYNIALAMKLEGVLDVAALERAFNTVVRRHASLRTTFRQDEQGAVQCIHPEVSLPLAVVDLTELSGAIRAQEVSRLVAQEGHRPFDLTKGPLLRVTLVKEGEGEHVMVVVVHHIVADGWSMGVMAREVEALYGAYVKGEEGKLEEVGLQYADYAVWQREWMKGEVLEEQLGWWRERLRGAPEVLEVPTDRARPAVQGYRGASVAVRVKGELAEGLRELSRREGVTLYMTLLAGFQTLLARYSGQWDVVVGSPVSGRTVKEVEGLIGFFVNTMVVRTEAGGELTFREMLGKVKESVLGALGHQEVPFEKLVEAMSPARDMSRAPLVQVVFQLQNAYSGDLALAGLQQRPMDHGLRFAKVDLALSLQETSEGLQGELDFSSDLYDVATMARFSEHLVNLLEAAVAEPSSRLLDLPLLKESSRKQLLTHGGREAPFEGQCLHRMFEAQVARTPAAVAVVMDGQVLTYAELDRRARKLARVLRQWGVRPDVVVALCLAPSFDWVVAVFAILKAGGAYLPMDPEHPAERLAYMLDDAKVALLVSKSEEASSLAYSGAMVLLDELGELPEVAGTEELAPEVTARNLAYVIYTSGSTGRPKGTLLEHRGASNLAEAFGPARGGIGPGERVLHFAPVSFDASVADLFPTLLSGATVVLARREQMGPGRPLAELLVREQVTSVALPPSVLALLPTGDYPSLRVIVSVGEACNTELVARWSPGRLFMNGYGPTEGTVCATLAECVAGERLTIGVPLRNVVTRVMDEAGQLVPPGVWGELYLGGMGLARGYLGRPELTAERFVPDPFGSGGRLYRTGDVVRVLADGRYEYLRRADHQVKVRGVRVEPGEVSAALATLPGVRSAVAMGREDTQGERRLVAYVVPMDDAALTVDVLRVGLKRLLPEPWIPSAFVLLRELPLTPNGKLDLKALPAPESHRPELSGGYVAPQEGMEQLLAQLVAEVLKLDRVGASDNFFDLGGNSLLLQMLQMKLEERLRRKVPLVLLLQYPSVRALAAQLGASEPEPQAPKAAVAASGDRREGLQRLARQRRQRPGSD